MGRRPPAPYPAPSWCPSWSGACACRTENTTWSRYRRRWWPQKASRTLWTCSANHPAGRRSWFQFLPLAVPFFDARDARSKLLRRPLYPFMAKNTPCHGQRPQTNRLFYAQSRRTHRDAGALGGPLGAAVRRALGETRKGRHPARCPACKAYFMASAGRRPLT